MQGKKSDVSANIKPVLIKAFETISKELYNQLHTKNKNALILSICFKFINGWFQKIIANMNLEALEKYFFVLEHLCYPYGYFLELFDSGVKYYPEEEEKEYILLIGEVQTVLTKCKKKFDDSSITFLEIHAYSRALGVIQKLAKIVGSQEMVVVDAHVCKKKYNESFEKLNCKLIYYDRNQHW